ncbi:MAG: formylglycine-generating enzyme family protein [Pirellulales bacterium]
MAAAGGAAVVLMLLGVIVVKIVNQDGSTTEVRVPEGSSVEVLKDGKTVAKAEDATGATPMAPSNPSSATPSANAPPLASAPFDAAQARAHQEAWAKYLGVPVEFTNSIGMRFRLIPPGEFTLGMTKEEAEAVAALIPYDKYWKSMALSSAPPHKVRLTQAFYLGTFEVTQEQYEKVVGANPSYFSATGEGKELVKDEDPRQHPVETVSFIDAAEFCIKLSQQEQLKPVYFSVNNVITLVPGDGYRLPTEAEWEWACRAGTTTSWFPGEQESALGTVAWFGGDRTHAVGQLKANPFGLYDVHGNVLEWCQDWHDAQAYAKRGANLTENPQGPDAGSARVSRGGDWRLASAHCRSAVRGASGIGLRNPRLGFRVMVGVSVSRSGPAADAPNGATLTEPANPLGDALG